MKVTVIPFVIGSLGIIPKGLIKVLENLEIRGQMETIQTAALLRSYCEESWRREETCCHSISIERPSANADVQKLSRCNNKNNMPSSGFCRPIEPQGEHQRK